MTSRSALASCIVALALLASSVAYADPVGIWYGEGQPQDPDILYLDQFNEDGTFKSEFRKYDRCEVLWRQIEEGRWSQEGDVIITHTHSLNGIALLPEEIAKAKQEYRVESASSTKLELRHLESDYLFVEYRFPSFEFFVCGVGS